MFILQYFATGNIDHKQIIMDSEAAMFIEINICILGAILFIISRWNNLFDLFCGSNIRLLIISTARHVCFVDD